MAEKTKGQKIVEKNKQLEDDRRPWIPLWQDVTDYILPYHGKYMKEGDLPNDELSKTDKIFNSTPSRAVAILAAGMQGGLTSPARPWFALGFEDVDLKNFGPVKDWLSAVERTMYALFNRSNFYSAIHSIYTELGGFNTACLYVEEDPIKFLRFRVMTAGEYCFALNDRNRLDTVYRRFFMQVKQILQRFDKDRVSDTVRNMEKDHPFKFVQVLHAIQPRRNVDITKLDNQSMPWESVYVELENPLETLSESGYEEFPCMGPRWDVVGSNVYGTGVGFKALPDVKMLQEMEQGILEAIHLELRPPMRTPSNYNKKLKMFPKAQNPVDVNQNDAVSKLFDFHFDIASTHAKAEQIEARIEQTFYNDLFRMIAETAGNRDRVTREEILQLEEEKLILIGPVIDRQIHELLDPIIDRVFGIGMRNFWFPPPPPEIQGLDLKVDYISLLAKAQKVVTTHSIDSMLGFVGNVAELYPNALDKIDMDNAIDERAEAIGVPSRMIRSDSEVEAIREAKAQQLAEQEQMEQAAAGVDLVKGVSEIDTGKDSALTKLGEALEGGALV
jgi:hypothetical protein